ncbi:huntingtin-interacting protein K isoform X1 [Trachypithecus francoisi]|uniref:huntingtin-interacting protein K isoform X1 n=1 Tax=Trachypithecus francoisi TaxID=54180 RepID=UPI00141B014B|nr:huntingtin-interacting protein K isoform X1 [Trachypithecus francoisi]
MTAVRRTWSGSPTMRRRRRSRVPIWRRLLGIVGSGAVTRPAFAIGHVCDWRQKVPGAESQTGAGERTGKSHYQEGRSGADNDRDGDISSSSRTQLAGTHGQRGRGAYCPNQLTRASTNIPTGLIYGNKIFFVFFSSIILGQVEYILYIYFVGNLYVGE